MRATVGRVRLGLLAFALALVLSGVTALVPLEGLALLYPAYAPGSWVHGAWPDLASWLALARRALQETYASYPFLAYGFDWLAFGHFVAAIPFLMAARDPLENTWVVPFGVAACLLVFPHAMIFGALRGIPLFWRLVDTLFGIGGIVLLLAIRRMLRALRPQAAGP